MIEKYSIEEAYSFFHQKWNVYRRSNMDWQKDDIEWAIGDYVSQMNPKLYDAIRQGHPHYLTDHASFAHDLEEAVSLLEAML